MGGGAGAGGWCPLRRDPSPSHHLTTRHSSPRGPSYNQAAGGLPCSARTCHLAEEKLSSQTCPRKVVSSAVLTLPGAERDSGQEDGEAAPLTSLGPNPPLPSYITHTNQAPAIAGPDNRRADNGCKVEGLTL